MQKWQSGNQDNVKMEARVHLKDDECKIVTNKYIHN